MPKVILIGDTAVGKSSIVNRIVNGTFNPMTRATTTFGVFLYESQDPDDPELEIWDTAGMEKYRAINRQYYRDAAAALLVFDLTRRPTFQNALDNWKADFEAVAATTSFVFLVGNKCDCQDGIAVSEEEARNWANANCVNYFPVSALTGEGIDDMLTGLLKMIPKDPLETDDVPMEDSKCC